MCIYKNKEKDEAQWFYFSTDRQFVQYLQSLSPSETDNFIKIRALIGKAFSPSENTIPTRYSMARINRSLTRNAIKSNYLALHRKKANLQQNLYNNTSLTNTSEDIREASIDLPKISVEKKKYFSYGCRIEDTNHENRRSQLLSETISTTNELRKSNKDLREDYLKECANIQ